MTDRELIAQALDVNAANLALGHEVFDADGARFVRNRAVPDIYDANHVTAITASTDREIDALFERVEREFEGYGHRRFDVDFRTPPSFEARLRLDGYDVTDALVMLLEGELPGQPRQAEITLVESPADWEVLAQLDLLSWIHYRERAEAEPQLDAGARMHATHRMKSPPVRFWLVHDEGEPRGLLSSWEGLEGVGQVETLFVERESRHRGLATALLHHCVADARKHGAGPIVIVASPTDTPKNMYARMGWRPLAVKREYKRVVA
jgi:GNAT superfamily N-acetyltransferase